MPWSCRSVETSYINGRVFPIAVVNPPLREAVARPMEGPFCRSSRVYTGGWVDLTVVVRAWNFSQP